MLGVPSDTPSNFEVSKSPTVEFGHAPELFWLPKYAPADENHWLKVDLFSL